MGTVEAVAHGDKKKMVNSFFLKKNPFLVYYDIITYIAINLVKKKIIYLFWDITDFLLN